VRILLLATFLFSGGPSYGCEIFRRVAAPVAQLLKVFMPDPNAPQSDRKWRNGRENWEKNIRETFRESAEGLQWNFEKLRASDREFLEEHFGFAFHANGKVYKIPTREQFIQRYRALMDKYVREGVIRPEEVILPGSAYEIEKGEGHGDIRLVGADERPKNGWSPLSPGSSPRLYTRMLREGYHPFDDGSFHDSLGHMLGFARYPKYMAAMRRLAGSPPVGEGKLTKDQWTIRYLYLLEGLSLMPASSRPALEQTLAPLFQKKGGPGVTVAQVEAHYSQMPREELAKQAVRLLKLYETDAEKYSGSAMELGALGYYSSRAEMRQSLYGLASTVFDSFRVPEKGKVDLQPNLLRAVAQLEVGLWESSFIPMEKFIEDFTNPNLPTTSPVYKFFVDTGISRDVPYYNDITGKFVREPGLIARSLTGEADDVDIGAESVFQDYGNLGRRAKGTYIEPD
jgi:hypothetical protein